MAPHQLDAAAPRGRAPPYLAIVTCIKSTPRIRGLNETALFEVLLPSLSKTITPAERTQHSIALYLCADDSDEFFRTHTAALRRRAKREASWLAVHLHFYPVVPNRVPSREAAARAYADGATYIHRTNDDIEYLSDGWVTAGVSLLGAMRPPNLGVVGPRVYGDGGRASRLLTVDLTHRTHLDIFHEYYPPQLYNWFVDDWISYSWGGGHFRLGGLGEVG